MTTYSRKLRSLNLRSRRQTTFVQSPELAQRNAQRPQLTPQPSQSTHSASPLLANAANEKATR